MIPPGWLPRPALPHGPDFVGQYVPPVILLTHPVASGVALEPVQVCSEGSRVATPDERLKT
ncbi:MAG TPA: hypothetical protein DCE47_22145 [Planctomycetaceae bacterium]|nr:hypothetical protein [Planctomycetaceae bacterium]HCD03313.1 hypothetical protein [Planctomycetaceae bacterium]